MSKAKNWCFTINNYTQSDESKIKEYGATDACIYLCIGREVGENGTPHLQGFIAFRERQRLSQVHAAISERGHFEVAKGTPAQASQYCKKDGDFIECGLLPKGKGNRSDIQQVQARILEGASRADIRDEFFAIYSRYPKAIDQYIMDVAPVRDWVTDVNVFWGKTGRGKTRAVFEFIEKAQIYVHPGESWFDGYTGQKVVLFDDFSGSEFKLSYLLKLLDRYPMRVPVKGGYANWVPRHVFITSNKDPDLWYENAFEEHRNALKRRITLIRKFD